MTRRAITYRATRLDDFFALHALVSIWEVTRNLGTWPWPPRESFTRGRCRAFDDKGFVWAICHDDRLIGTVGVTDGGLGYMLHPDHQGRGIVQRAAHKALAEAFQGAEALHAIIWSDNAASRHILRKLGFEFEKAETVHALARNELTPRETYRLTRTRWSALMQPTE